MQVKTLRDDWALMFGSALTTLDLQQRLMAQAQGQLGFKPMTVEGMAEQAYNAADAVLSVRDALDAKKRAEIPPSMRGD